MTSNRKHFGDTRAGHDRRNFLKTGAALLAPLATGFPGPGFGQGAAPVGFQLSWVKSAQYSGFFSGIDNGFYKQEGIEAVFTSGGPGIDTVANVAQGKSDMGDRPSGALIVARDKGIPIRIIGATFQKSPGSLLSPATKPIRSIRELAGKTVALPNTARPLVSQMIKEAGVDANSVTIVPVGTDPGILASGQVDAYYGYSTNQGMMLRMRGFNIHVLNMTDAGAPHLVGAIYARESFLKDHRDAVVRWLRASIRGWEWALANPEKSIDMLISRHGAPGLNHTQQLAELKESTEFIRGPAGKNGLLWLDAAIVQTEIDQMRTVGLVKSKLSAAELCDPQFIIAAHKKA
ncbi:MAG: hypothetical protein EXR27_08715 [Betaproteobacteria bacterium]|nr:hypothetical protein [Betaproteobacteria bacterium]